MEMSLNAAVMPERMEKAFIFAAEKAGLTGRDQVVEARARGDCATCEYLRYGLAKEVADYLGSMDKIIKAIYVFEPESSTSADGYISNRHRFVPGINMIIRVSRKTAALESLLVSVVSAVGEEFQRVYCPEANALCNMLDIITVDDHEVEKKTGYGALIGSLYSPPTEIWHSGM